jgi:hypothetical protein
MVDGVQRRWKHIRRGWDLFARNVRFEVGLGSKILFWHDT